MMEDWMGLIGVVVGAMITIGGQSLFRQTERGRRAKYLAIRTLVVLDRYVTSCASVMEPHPFEEHGAETVFEQPEVLELPSDVDWTSIGHDLSYELLSLPNRDAHAREAIRFFFEVGGSWDARDARDEEFATIGLQAHEIAERLRQTYKLPARPELKWDPVESLRVRMAEAAS